MSESDPPPASSNGIFDFIFGIFLKVISLLPEVGPEIGFVLDLAQSGISLSTNYESHFYVQDIEWKSFLVDKALSFTDAEEGLKNGLWAYVQASHPLNFNYSNLVF
jgi:hypothetical protein